MFQGICHEQCLWLVEPVFFSACRQSPGCTQPGHHSLMAPCSHLSLGAPVPRKVRPIRNQKELHLSGCPEDQSGATGFPVLGPSACRPSFITRKVECIALALAMWSHPPWPDFHGVFSSVIYLSEPPSPSELLAFFLHCPASFLQICSYTSSLRRKHFLFYLQLLPAPHPSPWPNNGQGDK